MRKKPRVILRKEEMRARTGRFDEVTYWRWEQVGKFPKRLRLGDNSVGWYEDEVDAWALTRQRVADAPPNKPPPSKRQRRATPKNHAA